MKLIRFMYRQYFYKADIFVFGCERSGWGEVKLVVRGRRILSDNSLK